MAFNYKRTVYFRDTDAAGVVYFAHTLSICHEAYEASLVAAGIDLKAFFSHPTLAIPIVHTSSDFFRPIYCGDRLLVRVQPQLLKPSEFEITYQIKAEPDPGQPGSDQLLGQAKTRHVCIDPRQRTRQELPLEIGQWLELWQGS